MATGQVVKVLPPCQVFSPSYLLKTLDKISFLGHLALADVGEHRVGLENLVKIFLYSLPEKLQFTNPTSPSNGQSRTYLQDITLFL